MVSGPSGLEPRFSDDRQWYWNGTAWIPASQAPVPPPPPTTAPPPQTVPTYAAAPQAGAAAMAVPQTKGHLGRNLAIGCAGLIGLIVIIGVIGSAANSGSKQPNSSSVAAVASPSATATKSVASTPTSKASVAPAGPKVLLDKTGSGTSKTAIFQTTGEWEIDYTFDCTNFGQTGNFQIYVFDGGSSLVDIPANALALKGSDTVYEHNLSGPYYLEMNSECNWRVIVKG
jgi:hypothetical protein